MATVLDVYKATMMPNAKCALEQVTKVLFKMINSSEVDYDARISVPISIPLDVSEERAVHYVLTHEGWTNIVFTDEAILFSFPNYQPIPKINPHTM